MERSSLLAEASHAAATVTSHNSQSYSYDEEIRAKPEIARGMIARIDRMADAGKKGTRLGRGEAVAGSGWGQDSRFTCAVVVKKCSRRGIIYNAPQGRE